MDLKVLGIVKNWLKETIKRSDFNVRKISVLKSEEWKLQNGSIVHRSGKFFRIIGMCWVGKNGVQCEQPFIEQTEVGTLGFLLREKSGKNQLLVQAKIEPGNVGICQLAPTCQATKSNAGRFHGGKSPPYIEYFNKKSIPEVYDKIQSEQGSRFFGKKNRNVLIKLKSQIPILHSHKWLWVDDVLKLLNKNFLINTDARSVLVCSPWNELVNRDPFSRYKKGFGFDLYKSFNVQGDSLKIKKMKNEIRLLREKVQKPKKISLEKLKKLKLHEKGLFFYSKHSFCVEQIKVEVKGREVFSWDQPIINSFSNGDVYLACGRKKGILHFLFKAESEIGLYNKVELTPTIVLEPGSKSTSKANKVKMPKGKIRSECWQSEEGGRFFQDINLFRIIDVGEAYDVPKNYYWLNLREIRKLLDEKGWFTNEARSVLSLLLSWM